MRDSHRRNDIGLRIKRLTDALQKQANSELEEKNLTFSQFHVMLYLALDKKEDHTASLKELEHHFKVAQATMAGIASRLEAKEFVVSVNDPADRRIKKIRLTEAGHSLLKEHKEVLDRRDKILLNGLSEEDVLQLAEYLDKLYVNITNNSESTKKGVRE